MCVQYNAVRLWNMDSYKTLRKPNPVLWEKMLPEDSEDRMDTKVTNEELYRKIQLAETLLQKVIQRKLRLFGHICRMNDSRKIKTLVFRMMDGSNKRGRPHREWSDDIEQWCGATLQELSHTALDRQRWAVIVTMASDTNGHWAHGCRWWWWWIWIIQKRFITQTNKTSVVCFLVSKHSNTNASSVSSKNWEILPVAQSLTLSNISQLWENNFNWLTHYLYIVTA